MSNTAFKLKSLCFIFACLSAAVSADLFASAENTAENFVQSLEVYNEVVMIQNDSGSDDEVIELSRQALNLAQDTTKSYLNEHLNGLGDKYYSLFIKGLELKVEGYSENDSAKIASAQQSLASWDDWYASHLDSIRRTN